ncbi:Breast carcinoma-amplified sequence 1, partial [Podiceps cristatus]
VDAKASVARDNAAVSSPKTMEQSPVPDAGGQSLGSAARRARTSAKPHSVFAFSWSVPGRTEDPATDSSVGSAKLDVSSEAPGVNKAPSDSVEVPAAAAREEGAHKNLTQAPPAASPRDIDLTASVTPEGEDAASSKPKQVTFFDRIFKLEKGKERSKTQIDTQEERQTSDLPDGRISAKEAAGLQSTSNGVPQGKANDCNQKDLQQDLAGVNGLTAEQPEKAEVKQDSPQPVAAVDNSVMSFLKTLVSPSKAEPKSDSEDKSPEQQPVTSLKSDRNVPSSQEPQTTKQNPKAPEPAAQQQAAATAAEAPREVTKEKASSTPMPLSKLFWKKVRLDLRAGPPHGSIFTQFCERQEQISSMTALLSGNFLSKRSSLLYIVKIKEKLKPPKANLRKFFKLVRHAARELRVMCSVQGWGSILMNLWTVNGQRPVAPAESEPVGQKSKESSKDKKSPVELSKQKGSKQEPREQPDSREQQAAETDSIQNGGDASKEPSFKKTEKRQSLGGFFKGLGSKRMSDAEVQTDPVSILPAGKSK